MRIGLHIKKLFGRSAPMELHLRLIEFTGISQLAPFGESEHLVAVIILQCIRIKPLKITDVSVLTFAQGTDEIILFIKPIRVAKDLIARGERLGAHVLTEKRPTIG